MGCEMMSDDSEFKWVAFGKDCIKIVRGMHSGVSEHCKSHQAAVDLAERLNAEDGYDG